MCFSCLMGGDEDLYDCSMGVVTRGSNSHCNPGSHTSRVEDSATHHTSKSRALSRGVLAGLLVFAARVEALDAVRRGRAHRVLGRHHRRPSSVRRRGALAPCPPDPRNTASPRPTFAPLLRSAGSPTTARALSGLSTGEFREALAALLGDDAAGLSATNIARLTNEWEGQRCGTCGRRREQRDWFHKLGNILDKLPKRLQPRVKAALHEVMYAETRGSRPAKR
jgi:hypothetical protein